MRWFKIENNIIESRAVTQKTLSDTLGLAKNQVQYVVRIMESDNNLKNYIFTRDKIKLITIEGQNYIKEYLKDKIPQEKLQEEKLEQEKQEEKYYYQNFNSHLLQEVSFYKEQIEFYKSELVVKNNQIGHLTQALKTTSNLISLNYKNSENGDIEVQEPQGVDAEEIKGNPKSELPEKKEGFFQRLKNLFTGQK